LCQRADSPQILRCAGIRDDVGRAGSDLLERRFQETVAAVTGFHPEAPGWDSAHARAAFARARQLNPSLVPPDAMK